MISDIRRWQKRKSRLPRMARRDGNCTAASFQSEPSSWTLSPLAWHKTQKLKKHQDSTHAIIPSITGQLSNPQNLYTSWVEHATHAPRVGNCLQILPTLSQMTRLTICLRIGARQLHLST